MPTLTTSVDMLLLSTDGVATSVDMYLSRIVSTSVDMLVVDSRGSFRGTMTAAERDALVAIQVRDTVIVTDDGFRLEHQFWDGTTWTKARHIEAPESGAE